MANLLAAVDSVSSASSPGTYAAMTDMTSGSVAVAGTGSVIRLKFMFTPTSGADLGAQFRFAIDGTAVSGGPVLPAFMDATNEGSAVTLTHYVTGLSAANHTFTVQWQTVTAGQTVNTSLTRRFEVIEWESGVTIEVDVNATGNQTLPTAFQDITGLTGTFTTASGAGHMMVANLAIAPGADQAAQLLFKVDSVSEGPLCQAWADSAAAEDIHGTSMEYFKTGLSAASHDFSLGGRQINSSGATCHASYVRTFQVIQFEGDFTLDVSVESNTADTTVGGTFTNMTGTMTPDATDSIVLVLASGVFDNTSADSCCVLQIFDDTTAVGAECWQFSDETNSTPGISLSYAFTGVSSSKTFNLDWETVSGTVNSSGTSSKVFQIIDFAAGGAAAFTLAAAAAAYSWTGTAANLEYHSVLSAAAAAYTWTGQVAALSIGYTLAAESAAYVWTGQTATLIFDAVLAAEAGAYTWTGQAATLTYLTGFVLDVEPAAWTWTGSEVGFLYDRIMAADAAGYTWTGTAATLTHAVVVGGPVDNYAGFMVNVGGMGRR